MEKKKTKGSRPKGKKSRRKKSPEKKRDKTEDVKVEPERLDLKEEISIEPDIRESIEKIDKREVPINTGSTSIEEKNIEDRQVKENKRDSIELDAAKPEEKQEELLSFFLGDEEYAIDILIIKEIIGIMDITFVPRTDEYIRGIISLRGAIIPVFNLRKRLGLGEQGNSDRGRIIVILIDDELIGITVDGVAEVVKIKGLDIESTPFTISGIDAEYIRGIVRYKGRIVILLDIVRLLSCKKVKT